MSSSADGRFPLRAGRPSCWSVTARCRRVRSGLCAALFAGLAGCGGDSYGPGQSRTLVRISPDTLSIAFGAVGAAFSVAVTDAVSGQPLERRLFWSVRNPTLARVDSAGAVVSLGIGETWVLVSDGRSLDSSLLRIATRFVSIHAGADVTCALGVTGHAFCWGWNEFGQVGDGTVRDALAPARVATAAGFSRLATAAGTTCALPGGPGLWCWGYNGVGQLADGTIEDRRVPVHVATAHSFESLILGAGTTPCGRTSDGENWCWAWNAYGQLLDGTRINRRAPVRLSAAAGLVWVSAGGGHVCGLDVAGAPVCWGRNDLGQLGDGSTGTRESPGPVPDVPALAGLAVGEAHTCGWTPAGEAWCWGDNSYGQSGGTGPVQPVPGRVGTGLSFDTLVSSRHHTCGLVSGAAWCWGNNDYGQIGVGAGSSAVPLEVATALRFRQISAGTTHTCALSVDGLAWCWGSNTFGALGTGTRAGSGTPVRVRYQLDVP